jgi:hypothetical protein
MLERGGIEYSNNYGVTGWASETSSRLCIPNGLYDKEMTMLYLGRIWGSHSGGYEEYHLLGYNAV